MYNLVAIGSLPIMKCINNFRNLVIHIYDSSRINSEKRKSDQRRFDKSWLNIRNKNYSMNKNDSFEKNGQTRDD